MKYYLLLYPDNTFRLFDMMNKQEEKLIADWQSKFIFYKRISKNERQQIINLKTNQ